jgi:hypothetical protein
MPMNNIEGKIVIELEYQPGQSPRVQIHSSRPVLASKVFTGKPPAQVLELIPLMFNICGCAQARTAVAALRSAGTNDYTPSLEAARDILVLVENAREHLFRIFVDWPTLCAGQVDSQALHPLGSLMHQFREALFETGSAFAFDSQVKTDPRRVRSLIDCIDNLLSTYVMQLPAADWLQLQDFDDLNRWAHDHDGIAALCTASIIDQGWSSQGRSAVMPLPELAAAELGERLRASDADRFIEQPDWHGQTCDTTSLARQLDHLLIRDLIKRFGHSLLPRWVARLVELARIPEQLRGLLERIEHGEAATDVDSASDGLAQTEAARGRLVHRAQLDNGVVSSYQILAPTEWNFHPRGLIAESLGNLRADNAEQLEKLARLVINTIDPCVGYELHIQHPVQSNA